MFRSFSEKQQKYWLRTISFAMFCWPNRSTSQPFWRGLHRFPAAAVCVCLNSRWVWVSFTACCSSAACATSAPITMAIGRGKEWKHLNIHSDRCQATEGFNLIGGALCSYYRAFSLMMWRQFTCLKMTQCTSEDLRLRIHFHCVILCLAEIQAVHGRASRPAVWSDGQRGNKW